MDTVLPISNFEYTRLIGIRSEQLARGAKIMTDYTGLRDPIKIAEKEFAEGTIPLSIVRNFPRQQIVVDIVKK